MATTTVNFRVDEETKRNVEELLDSMGITVSGAINMFFKQILLEKALPFQPRAVEQKKSREAILERGREALREAQEQAKVNGTSDMTLDEINEIIAEVRQDMRAEKAAQ